MTEIKFELMTSGSDTRFNHHLFQKLTMLNYHLSQKFKLIRTCKFNNLIKYFNTLFFFFEANAVDFFITYTYTTPLCLYMLDVTTFNIATKAIIIAGFL